MKRNFVYALATALVVAMAVEAAEKPVLKLSDKFPRVKAPGTGRLAVQLTSGSEANYPLYYFIPSISRDGKYLTFRTPWRKLIVTK